MELGRVLAGTRTHVGLGSATRGRRTLAMVTRAVPTTCQIKEVLEVKVGVLRLRDCVRGVTLQRHKHL